MSFLTGSLLFGLVAAAVPVIIHLLHRQRTVPVQWGAMQFLLEAPLQFRRRRKVDHWLLLLARIAMLALLAFLLARPLLRAAALSPLAPGAGADVAVVLDHSLSAGRKAGAEPAAASQESVFQRGARIVESVASGMRPNDTLSVVLAEHRPDTSLTPVPVRSAGAPDVLNRLRQIKPGMTAAAVPDAVRAARELVARGPNAQKVVLVVTDDQRNAWRIYDAAAWSAALGDRAGPAATRVYSLPVPAEANARDVVVGDLSVEPSVVGVKRPAQITATLTNSGPGDVAAVAATLRVNGKEAGRQSFADLKAGTSHTVRFDHTFADAGSNWVEVRADVDDALAADNTAVAAVNVRQRLPVLVIDGQLTGAGNFRSSQFLLAAMQPVAEQSQASAALIQPKVVSAGAADAEKLDDYAAVVVNDVPQLGGSAVESLASYARSGHGVWIVLGPRTDPALLAKQLAQARLLTADFAEAKPLGATPPGVELKSPQNPTVALLAAAERNAMTGAVTRRWWRLTPRDGDEQVVLASSQGGDPLVIERPVGRNGGRLVVWCTSADGAWNNWPLMPNFVPLVNETVFHLAGAGSPPAQSRVTAGAPLEWSAPAEPRLTSATLTRPDGKTVPLVPVLSAGRQRITYNDTADPGLYTLRFEPTSIPQPAYFAVNIDPHELDPATLTDADYAWLTSRKFLDGRLRPGDLPSALAGTSPGAELSRWLALGVLALLVFETVMTRRMVRLQAAPVAPLAQGGIAQP
jgi:hypothetical protein